MAQLEFPFILYSSMVLAGAVSVPAFLCSSFGSITGRKTIRVFDAGGA
jgi:hypothetical protein